MLPATPQTTLLLLAEHANMDIFLHFFWCVFGFGKTKEDTTLQNMECKLRLNNCSLKEGVSLTVKNIKYTNPYNTRPAHTVAKVFSQN